MIAAILSALAALPKLFDFIERAVLSLSVLIDQIKKERDAKLMEKASENARETKDTRQIEDLLKRK